MSWVLKPDETEGVAPPEPCFFAGVSGTTLATATGVGVRIGVAVAVGVGVAVMVVVAVVAVVAVRAGVAFVVGVETALVAVGLADMVGKAVGVDVGFAGFCVGSLGANSTEAASARGAGNTLDTRLRTRLAMVIAQTTLCKASLPKYRRTDRFHLSIVSSSSLAIWPLSSHARARGQTAVATG